MSYPDYPEHQSDGSPQPAGPAAGQGGQGEYGQAEYGQAEYGQLPYGGYPAEPYGQPVSGAPRPPRPGTVVVGCVMAWVGSAVGLLIGLFFFTLSPSSSILRDTATASGRSVSSLQAALHLAGGLLMVWCLATVVVAFLAFRGARWAAIALLVLAGVTVLLTVISLVSGSGGQGALLMGWSVCSAALVFSGAKAKAWFRAVAARNQQFG